MKISNLLEKNKMEPVKPRNFVAKNAMKTTSGAGAHRDKKKEQKQGYEKHKGKQLAETATKWDINPNTLRWGNGKEASNEEIKAWWNSLSQLEYDKWWNERENNSNNTDAWSYSSGNNKFNYNDKKAQDVLKSFDHGRKVDLDGGGSYQHQVHQSLVDPDWKNPKGGLDMRDPEAIRRSHAARINTQDFQNKSAEEKAGWDAIVTQQIADAEKYQKTQGISEGLFGIDSRTKGAIQNVVSQLSDIPGMWDHKAQTFTSQGLKELQSLLKNNEQHIEYAVNLTADDFDEGIDETSDFGEPREILEDVLRTLEREVEWPLTEIMDPREVKQLLAPIVKAINNKMMSIKEGRRDYGYDSFGNSLRPGDDEGNTEPPNNFAIYINGKKWKVFQGRGQYADDQYEMQQFRQLQAMAARKSQETGKKWEVVITGEAPTA